MIDYIYLEMEDSLNLLILLLKRVDSDTLIEVTNDYYLITHPLIDAIKYVANECLIGEDGHPDRENMDTIVRAGFPIFPGEQDRFGWLTGCIELSRGLITFG